MGGKRRSNKKTQPIQAAPMGGDVGYGEGEQARQAQAAVPLPDKRVPMVQGATGPVAAAAPPTEMGALDAARAYNPTVMPLNAPDDLPMLELMRGAQRRAQSPEAATKRRRDLATMQLLEQLAESTQDPKFIAAADRMRFRL